MRMPAYCLCWYFDGPVGPHWSKGHTRKYKFWRSLHIRRESECGVCSKNAIQSKYPQTVRINAPSQTDVRYFLERDDKAHTQFITVRGTVNGINFSEDFDVTVRDDRKIKIPVHAGFDLAARAVYQDVRPYLKTGYKTYLSGHSLGGAVAAVLAIYLIEDGVDVVRAVTFGQPRFTTADGVKQLGFLPLARVVDENDIVPMVPRRLCCIRFLDHMSKSGQRSSCSKGAKLFICPPTTQIAFRLESSGGRLLLQIKRPCDKKLSQANCRQKKRDD